MGQEYAGNRAKRHPKGAANSIHYTLLVDGIRLEPVHVLARFEVLVGFLVPRRSLLTTRRAGVFLTKHGGIRALRRPVGNGITIGAADRIGSLNHDYPPASTQARYLT